MKNDFFIIESGNLDATETRLYGWCIRGSEIFTDASQLSGGEEPSCEGAYVYIKAEEDRITIFQDFVGSYGLYLFREGD